MDNREYSVKLETLIKENRPTQQTKATKEIFIQKRIEK